MSLSSPLPPPLHNEQAQTTLTTTAMVTSFWNAYIGKIRSHRNRSTDSGSDSTRTDIDASEDDNGQSEGSNGKMNPKDESSFQNRVGRVRSSVTNNSLNRSLQSSLSNKDDNNDGSGCTIISSVTSQSVPIRGTSTRVDNRERISSSSNISMKDVHRMALSLPSSSLIPDEANHPSMTFSFTNPSPTSLVVGNYDDINTVASQSLLSLTPTMVEHAMDPLSVENENNSSEKKHYGIASPDITAYTRDIPKSISPPSTLQPDTVLCPFCQNEKDLQWHHGRRRRWLVLEATAVVAVVAALMAASFAIGIRWNNMESLLTAHAEECRRMLEEERQMTINTIYQQQGLPFFALPVCGYEDHDHHNDHQVAIIQNEPGTVASDYDNSDGGIDTLSAVMISVFGSLVDSLVDIITSERT